MLAQIPQYGLQTLLLHRHAALNQALKTYRKAAGQQPPKSKERNLCMPDSLLANLLIDSTVVQVALPWLPLHELASVDSGISWDYWHYIWAQTFGNDMSSRKNSLQLDSESCHWIRATTLGTLEAWRLKIKARNAHLYSMKKPAVRNQFCTCIWWWWRRVKFQCSGSRGCSLSFTGKVCVPLPSRTRSGRK